MRMRRMITAALVTALLCGCGPENNGQGQNNENATTGTSNATTGPTNNTTNGETNNATNGQTNNDTTRTNGATTFRVTIENNSDATAMPTAISPGVWAVGTPDNPFWTQAEPGSNSGITILAEQGDNGPLSAEVAEREGVVVAGTFDAVAPGESVEWTFDAPSADHSFHFTGMFVESNDTVIVPAEPVDLARDPGPAFPLDLADIGSEADQAPRQGPDQQPRQSEPEQGAAEGVVRPFSDTTRAVPAAVNLADVEVFRDGDTFIVEVENVTGRSGLLGTPLSPMFYAVHDDRWSLHQRGEPASDALERLAEDGSPEALLAETDGAEGVLEFGAEREAPDGVNGPIGDGESYTFQVTPDADHRFLTIATMVVQTNDAYVAPIGNGIALYDENGEPVSTEEIADAIHRKLAVFDAGTEQNEVPGVGRNQPPRQDGDDVGPADPNDAVRLYSDPTNDIGWPTYSERQTVEIESAGPGEFVLTITNTSGESAYPANFSELVWAVHSEDAAMFQTGEAASAELEALAEDGAGTNLATVLSDSEGVLTVGVEDQTMEGEPAPLVAGASYQVTLFPDETYDRLSLATMLQPSNDTFMGVDAIRLVDDQGEPRPVDEINAELEEMFRPYDAGTEANQAGAGGLAQAPRQSSPGSGLPEGDGNVAATITDWIPDPWAYPDPDVLFSVTVERVQ